MKFLEHFVHILFNKSNCKQASQKIVCKQVDYINSFVTIVISSIDVLASVLSQMFCQTQHDTVLHALNVDKAGPRQICGG